MKPLIRLPDDGLPTPEVGPWAENKYDLIRYYSDLFSTSMRRKWNSRVYLDLFSAAGHARIKNSKSVLPGSPLIALGLDHPFDRYIFCEKEAELMAALQNRVKAAHPSADCRYVSGDVNETVDQIFAAMPQHGPGMKVLTFCVADPCKLRDLKFETIRKLSERFMDFLVLIPSGMDANRNMEATYVGRSPILDEFLGTTSWRQEWASDPRRDDAGAFVADQFGKQMATLNYRYSGLESAWLNRSTNKNLLLYYLMFFSRHELGDDFWNKARKATDPQGDLFEGQG